MENGENSPDEFFGSRRMTGIANGVAGMLISQEPPAPTSSSRSLWVVYGVVLGIIALQIGGMVRSVRPSWQDCPTSATRWLPAPSSPSLGAWSE
jgi:hypothetical protein